MRNMLLCLIVLLCASMGHAQRVVIYTSIDQPFAKPILDEFSKQTGIEVVMRGDVEAAKTAGLAERLRAEKDNPQADVWWSNEIFHTIALADEKLLQPYVSPVAADIPALFKDPTGLWSATAVRVRVIGVHPSCPIKITSLQDLTNPALKGKVSIARPAFGTTGGHVAALLVAWGPQKFQHYFRALHANETKILGGNAMIARYVSNGQLFAGFTDNDDVSVMLEQGGKIEGVLPDQGPDGLGTLAVPTTVGLVSGARNVEAAKKLIDYLLSPAVEQKLIDGKFASHSVRPKPDQAQGARFMQIDYPTAARAMPQAIRTATAILEGRE